MKEEIRITQYADDATLILTDLPSVTRSFEIANYFGTASGAIINKSKSKGLWLGAWANKRPETFNINMTSSFLKFYGVYLGNDNYSAYNTNNIRPKFASTIDLLKTRHLAMTLKPHIINVFACSKLWHVYSTLPLDKTSISFYTKYIFNYFWYNGPEFIKRNVIYKDFCDGGLRMVNIPTKIEAFHIKHIYQFLFGSFKKWHSFTEYWLGFQLRNLKPLATRNMIPHAPQPSAFYESCLSSFKQTTPLFGNSLPTSRYLVSP
jgi:hypothetical protein